MLGRRMRLLLAVLAALLVLPAVAEARLKVGIGDQKPAMFGDPRFRDLGLRHARLTVPWDALEVRWQREELERWLFAAREARVEVLISYGHSRRPNRRRVLPRPGQMSYEFALFRKRYPWVRNFAVWNEANHCGEPTCHRAGRVVEYYRAMRRTCPSCRLLAAELLDFPNMTAWVRAFQRRLGFHPALWGLHNYRDANYLRTGNTRALLRATRARIWLTETGGIVKRRNRSSVRFPESARHAAKATRWVFDRLVPLSRRIERVYLYHWNASTPHDTWDSGLISWNGRTRPAYRVVRRVMRSGLRPPRGVRRRPVR